MCAAGAARYQHAVFVSVCVCVCVLALMQAFPAVQAAPSFSQCFPVVLGGRKDMFCLIPQAIDQVCVLDAVLHAAVLPARSPCHVTFCF